MKSFIISMIAVLAKRLLDASVWASVEHLVKEADEAMKYSTGEEKRAWVISHALDAAQWMINLAVEVIVAQRKV